MSDLDKMAMLVTKTWEGETDEFGPCAFFDDRLDCVRVIARDCSVLEERISDRITVLVDAHHSEDRGNRYVGIKGARHFCKQQDLSPGVIKMTVLLDAILKSCPEEVVQMFIEYVARPLIKDKHIEQVEILDSVLEPT